MLCGRNENEVIGRNGVLSSEESVILIEWSEKYWSISDCGTLSRAGDWEYGSEASAPCLVCFALLGFLFGLESPVWLLCSRFAIAEFFNWGEEHAAALRKARLCPSSFFFFISSTGVEKATSASTNYKCV